MFGNFKNKASITWGYGDTESLVGFLLITEHVTLKDSESPF